MLLKTVLFACIHNAGRSQMAAAWFNHLADRTKARAISAGTEPGSQVHPEVLSAMQEVGIDLSDAKPRFLSDELARTATLLITMGCGEACPYVPGLRREDWPLEDPKGKSIERIREIRDDVKARVQALLGAEGWAPARRRHSPAPATSIPQSETSIPSSAKSIPRSGRSPCSADDLRPTGDRASRVGD